MTDTHIAETPVDTGPVAFSMEEIEDFNAPAPDAPKSDEQEAIIEEKEAEKEAEAEVIQEVKEEKKTSKYVPRERLNEVAAQRDDAKKFADEQRALLAETQAREAKLIEFIRKATEGKTPAEAEAIEDEIVDVKAYKHLTEEINGLKNKLEVNSFQHTIDSEKVVGNRLHADFDKAVDHVVAHKAWEMMENAKTLNTNLSQEEAIKQATTDMVTELYTIKQKAGSLPSGALAEHVYRQAQVRGYKTAANTNTKPKIDMAAVAKARETAAAPAIEKTSVSMNNGQWGADLVAQAKEDGLTPEYMAKLGITA